MAFISAVKGSRQGVSDLPSRDQQRILDEQEKFQLFWEARDASEAAELKKQEAYQQQLLSEKEVANSKVTEASAEKEVEEAVVAEREAAVEIQNALDAKTRAEKEALDVVVAEKELEELEAKLRAGAGDVTSADVEHQRGEVAREKREAAEEKTIALQNQQAAEEKKKRAVVERAEATEAVEAARLQRTRAEESVAAAIKAQREAGIAILDATKAQSTAERVVWKQQRVAGLHPIAPADKIYQLILDPAFAYIKFAKKGQPKKGRKRLDNQLKTMHRQCDEMFEDREFLEECFDLLREDEDEDEGDSYLPPVKMMKLDKMALWVTVLNHGQTPSDEDMAELERNLDEYNRMMLTATKLQKKKKNSSADDDSDDFDPDVDNCNGLFEWSHFLLVTFDYYLAMGPARMRSLYMDLMLT